MKMVGPPEKYPIRRRDRGIRAIGSNINAPQGSHSHYSDCSVTWVQGPDDHFGCCPGAP